MANWSDTLWNEKNERGGDGKTRALDVLQEFESYYDAMSGIYESYDRCKDFVNGKQWGDMTCFQGVHMTEEEMMERQGRYAVVNNFLKILIRNYKGMFIKQDMEPTCKARKSELQPMADALSTALQYNWDLNSQKELNADIFEEGLISPIFAGKVSIGNMNGKYDVWTEPVQIKRFVVDNNTQDPRGLDIECIGEIHDMSRAKVINTFAKKPGDKNRIRKIYENCSKDANLRWVSSKLGDRSRGRNFYTADEYGQCRVYEIWKKEYRDGYACHDFLNGDYFAASSDEIKDIEAENKQRIDMARLAGIPEEDIEQAQKVLKDTSGEELMPQTLKLIKYDYFYEDYWYYRFLAPNGEVIAEGESPYAHKQHPYIFRIYPLMGGSARSFIDDVIDLQKDINRMDAMYDWIVRHAAKGALLMPRDQMDIEHGWNLKKYGQAWSQPDAVIPFNPKAGATVPQQISKNNTDIGIVDHMARKMQWTQDITGVQGTLQGKKGYAGTSGSLYAQQTENATTSLLDLINKFSGWTKDLSLKQVQCMQQCYDEQKFMDICGSYGSVYKDLKDIYKTEVYMRVSESASSQIYRAIVNDELKWMVEMGMIDINTYLSNSTLPFGWKIQNEIAQKAQEAAQNGQQPLPTSVPQMGAEASIAGSHAQGTGDNAYNRSVAQSANAIK